MSVIVRGMEIPEKCGLCDLFHAESPMHCTVVKGHKTVGAPYGMPRPDWCPLVEVPEKHGRLIDADKLMDDIKKNSVSYFADDFAREWVDVQPTVIEAEGER